MFRFAFFAFLRSANFTEFKRDNLGSAPTTYIGSRVGSDFPKTSILNVGSGRVGDLVGRLVGIFEVNLAKKSSS
jgi:hypothetical protein